MSERDVVDRLEGAARVATRPQAHGWAIVTVNAHMLEAAAREIVRLREELEVARMTIGAMQSGCCYKVECAESTLNDHDMGEEADTLARRALPPASEKEGGTP